MRVSIVLLLFTFMSLPLQLSETHGKTHARPSVADQTRKDDDSYLPLCFKI